MYMYRYVHAITFTPTVYTHAHTRTHTHLLDQLLGTEQDWISPHLGMMALLHLTSSSVFRAGWRYSEVFCGTVRKVGRLASMKTGALRTPTAHALPEVCRLLQSWYTGLSATISINEWSAGHPYGAALW